MYIPHRIPEGLPFQLCLSPCPTGRTDLHAELARIAADGVGHIVSLLEPEEATSLGLTDEAQACAELGIHFHHLSVRDGSIPGYARYVKFMDDLATALADGRGLLVHCRHGIGRSSLIVIGLLLRNGMNYPEAAALASDARGAILPATPPQRRLLMAYAQQLKG